MKIHSDRQLVDKLLKGDQKAFAAFFNLYCPRLFNFARARLWNDDDLAEEVVQISLAKAVSKLNTYRAEAALYTWLCTFCRYEISNILLREGKLGRKVELVEDDPDVMAALESMAISASSDPIAQYKKTQVVRFVQVAKDNIPILYSDVLDMKYLYGDSVREIAAKIGRSQKATESILTRARVSFKEAFTAMTHANKAHINDIEW